MSITLPTTGFVFWPVGCGDSTTVAINDDTVIQIDIHHVEDSEKDDDPRSAIVDELVEILPKRDGKPYLAAFGATHLDEDHIKGFAELLERVTIGDLWFTPRILWEQKNDPDDTLCDDAKAFADEAERRIKLMKKKRVVGSGDRIRIIGYHESLEEHSDIYEDLPEGAVTVPGNSFDHIDGEDQSAHFSAFVHAPFKEDTEGERNDTSFALQVTLNFGDATGRALLLGDLKYPILQKIFDRSEDETLEWDLLLAPHHCSKSVMYWPDEGDDEPKLKQDFLDQVEAAKRGAGYVIASCGEIPATNKKGDNPPHVKAADRYKEIVEDGHFLCTGEHPDAEAPTPIVFELGDIALELRDDDGGSSSAKSSRIKEAISMGRGAAAPAAAPVGFGAR